MNVYRSMLARFKQGAGAPPRCFPSPKHALGRGRALTRAPHCHVDRPRGSPSMDSTAQMPLACSTRTLALTDGDYHGYRHS